MCCSAGQPNASCRFGGIGNGRLRGPGAEAKQGGVSSRGLRRGHPRRAACRLRGSDDEEDAASRDAGRQHHPLIWAVPPTGHERCSRLSAYARCRSRTEFDSGNSQPCEYRSRCRCGRVGTLDDKRAATRSTRRRLPASNLSLSTNAPDRSFTMVAPIGVPFALFKKAASVPVVVSGDIHSFEDAARALATSGADASISAALFRGVRGCRGRWRATGNRRCANAPAAYDIILLLRFHLLLPLIFSSSTPFGGSTSHHRANRSD